MCGDPPADPDPAPEDSPGEIPSGPPEKMGFPFYAALALVVLLVLMVVFLNAPAARANAGTAITQTTWTLRSYTDATGIHLPVISAIMVTARFDKDGRVTGSAGCNGYAADFQTLDYTINISRPSSTKMLCQEQGVMEQESAFLDDLSDVSSFRVGESFLRLYDARGKPVLVFVPA